ncbi:MAG: YccF domain-containing protein [Pseudonocardia sp.]
MRTIGNVLWFLLAGWWLALSYLVAGIVACLLVVTIPFGIASFRLAGHALWPFGRTVVRDPDAGVASLVGNVVWIVLFGWWLALGHVVAGVLLILTIIGIPFGVASLKLAVLALAPLGARVIDTAHASVPAAT